MTATPHDKRCPKREHLPAGLDGHCFHALNGHSERCCWCGWQRQTHGPHLPTEQTR